MNYEQIIRWDPEWIIAGAKGGTRNNLSKHVRPSHRIDASGAKRTYRRGGQSRFPADVAVYIDVSATDR